jgi:hypothetical protein
MKTNIIVTFAGIGFLVLFAVAFVSIFEIKLASAQVDASSSVALITATTTTPEMLGTSTSTAPAGNVASSTSASTFMTDTSSTTTPATSTPETSVPVAGPAPQGLTLVHIIGTKYVDYFTDGSTVTSYPGDPTIDGNLSKRDAPIPTHPGLTWDHTSGYNLYDTPSGDLELGDYAVQQDGSYIENTPPFASSTSTQAVSSPTDSTSTAPAVLGTSTTTDATSSDTFIPPGTWTATDTDSTESPSPDAPGSSSAASSAPATTTGN